MNIFLVDFFGLFFSVLFMLDMESSPRGSSQLTSKTSFVNKNFLVRVYQNRTFETSAKNRKRGQIFRSDSESR